MYAISVTGHRPHKLFSFDLDDVRYGPIREFFRKVVTDAIEKHGPIKVINGGALGVDQLFAITCLEMTKEGFPIENVMIQPCENQDKKWTFASRRLYRTIVDRMDRIDVVSPVYTDKCMQDRNEAMVNESDLVIAIWDGSSGGTGNCVRYAKKCGKPIIVRHPMTGVVEVIEGRPRQKSLMEM